MVNVYIIPLNFKSPLSIHQFMFNISSHFEGEAKMAAIFGCPLKDGGHLNFCYNVRQRLTVFLGATFDGVCGMFPSLLPLIQFISKLCSPKYNSSVTSYTCQYMYTQKQIKNYDHTWCNLKYVVQSKISNDIFYDL